MWRVDRRIKPMFTLSNDERKVMRDWDPRRPPVISSRKFVKGIV